MSKQISILGCGWLGLPLAERLMSQGYTIKGSTTSKNRLSILENAGITPFLIQLKEHRIEGNLEAFLQDSDVLIIAFPPKLQKNPEANFVSKMTHFVNTLKQRAIPNVIYVSSTSVFQDKEADDTGFRVITEDITPDGTSRKARQLIEGETLLQDASEFKTTIIRFGGLLGKQRHPAKYLAGRTGLKNPEAPVNLIHLRDCLAIIEGILDTDSFGTVFHGVNPIHQSRKAYYQFTAEAMDLEKPEFDDNGISLGKVIYSKRLNTDLGFEFQEEI